jgi:hypothetical protein
MGLRQNVRKQKVRNQNVRNQKSKAKIYELKYPKHRCQNAKMSYTNSLVSDILILDFFVQILKIER